LSWLTCRVDIPDEQAFDPEVHLLAGGGELRLVGAAVGGMMGAFGHTLGATRAAAMRLQALSVLERNDAPR